MKEGTKVLSCNPPQSGNGKSTAVSALSIEQRLALLEEKITRFENAIFSAADMMLQNPVASAMMPKEIKTQLRQYLDERKSADVQNK